MSIDALHAAAAAAGKRLVLTGHSLGGAVATLTTVRLLRGLALGQQQAVPDPRIRCISFATPAVANADLLQEVAAAGWDQFITNIILPGEQGCRRLQAWRCE
jgi:alpha-beta hydrolase superfamily lysophospholipase